MRLITRLFVLGSIALASASSFALAALPTSGTCGFTISGSYPFTGVQTAIPGTWSTVGTVTTYTGNSASASGSLNMLGTVDFGTSTITINSVSQTAMGSKAPANNTNAPVFTNTQNTTSTAFTASASSSVSGMYVLSLSSGGSINVVPVNGGKTILFQQFASNDMGGRIGICQF